MSRTAASSSPRCANIAAGDELNYDYGLIIEERYPRSSSRVPCWCSSPNCRRGTLLAPAQRGWAPPAQEGQREEPRKRAMAATMRPSGRRLSRCCRAGSRCCPASTHQQRADAPRARRSPEPTLLVAEQTAGRGRLGREWHTGTYEGTACCRR